jgi:hypothetical protein
VAGYVDGDLGEFAQQGEEKVEGWAAEEGEAHGLFFGMFLCMVFGVLGGH